MKKNLMLFVITVMAISWIMLIPVGVKNSFLKVDALKATSTDVVNTIDCSGTLQAAKKYQVVLGCQVKISKNFFNIGDKVRKGDKLLAIDKNVTLQALNCSNMSSIGKSASSSDTNLRTSIGDAENLLKQALSTGIISKDTYSSISEKIKDSGVSGISSSNFGISPNTTLTELDENKIFYNISNSLRSPISGIVTDIEDGTAGILPAGTTLAEIVDFNQMRVKAQVDENNIKTVKVGQHVYITGSGFSGTYSGTVQQIYPVAENVTTSSGTGNMVTVIIKINKPNEHLLPGLTANVTIKTSEQRGIVKLPYDSIMQDDDGTEYVYVFKNGKAIRQNVTTGTEDNSGVVILKGVSQGEIVIENSTENISNGLNVRLQ